MEIQTIWENGVFKPVKPLRLKRMLVTIKVPDEEIADIGPAKGKECTSISFKPAQEVQEGAEALLKRLELKHKEILALPEDKHPPITEKQFERVQAMEMREDL